jgi:flagellar motor switch/type III secretory pathway protein FliN
LPLASLSDRRVIDALSMAVNAWSGRWFSGSGYSLKVANCRDTRRRVVPNNPEYVPVGSFVFLEDDAQNRQMVALFALDAPNSKPSLSGPDAVIVGDVAREIFDDLANTLAATINGTSDLREGDGLQLETQKEGLEIGLESDSSLPQLRLFVPLSALVRFRKSFIQSQYSSPTGGLSMSEALSEAHVDCHALLGQAHLSVAEMLKLETGDVLVLDQALGQAIKLTATDSGNLICQAEISQSDNCIQLKAAA